MSELYGRRPVMVGTFILFTIFTMACGVAPNWAALIIFRTLCGICASCPIAVTGGLFADVYQSPLARGRTMALSMAITTAGPQFAPLIAGFVAPAGWRWIFWISLILAGVTLVPVLFQPETSPAALGRSTKPTGEGILVRALTRPLYMIFCEPIISLTCLYLSYAGAIFCEYLPLKQVCLILGMRLTHAVMYFEAYPLIFQGTYGMSAGVAGLAFLPSRFPFT